MFGNAFTTAQHMHPYKKQTRHDLSEELVIMSFLSPPLEAELRWPVSPTMGATDACLTGAGAATSGRH